MIPGMTTDAPEEKPPAKPLTSRDIVERLRLRYDFAEGWIGMAEVTPPGTDRRFDFLAIQSWRSRGLDVHGCEIKVSRGDWLRELATPAKADPLVRLCSRWWIVAPPGVAKVEELPPAWGLIVVYDGSMRAAKQAPALKPEPWDAETWQCMMLRLATREARTPDDIARAKREAAMEAEARADESWKRRVKQERERIAELEKVIGDAEKATGVSLSKWTDFPALGEAMKMLREGGHDEFVRQLDNKANMLRRASVQVRLAARSIRQGRPAPS